jgi:hypothetical protein
MKSFNKYFNVIRARRMRCAGYEAHFREKRNILAVWWGNLKEWDHLKMKLYIGE